MTIMNPKYIDKCAKFGSNNGKNTRNKSIYSNMISVVHGDLTIQTFYIKEMKKILKTRITITAITPEIQKVNQLKVPEASKTSLG